MTAHLKNSSPETPWRSWCRPSCASSHWLLTGWKRCHAPDADSRGFQSVSYGCKSSRGSTGKVHDLDRKTIRNNYTKMCNILNSLSITQTELYMSKDSFLQMVTANLNSAPSRETYYMCSLPNTMKTWLNKMVFKYLWNRQRKADKLKVAGCQTACSRSIGQRQKNF